MSGGAWVMFGIGALGLWGSLIFFIANYFRSAARERDRAE